MFASETRSSLQLDGKRMARQPLGGLFMPALLAPQPGAVDRAEVEMRRPDIEMLQQRLKQLLMGAMLKV